ncbi:hypothetical protein WR25_16948 [Diploscapter pachys]|uniref:Uncharacterized protein n=1 Tax=Diploscapter pachys TaxID=2018661 RepID=A0A2A2KR46_9BILA|nr:hypothetical protein WR25_16948 [Diploscapter pachys]
MLPFLRDFHELRGKKQDFLNRQKRTSLLVDPLTVEDQSTMFEYSKLFKRVATAPMNVEDHKEQLNLIEEIVKDSIIIEWPRAISGFGKDAEMQEVDFAPLIHRARNVVKCRTSHPTMRIKVCAISREDNQSLIPHPKVVEAFFRATLVKLAHDGNEPKQVAGRMILTQREGTPATKSADQNGATVNAEGKLIASQASEPMSLLLLNQMAEHGAKTTPFKYENGVLCATFPEMGVTLNSMVDRRQLATRYAIQVEVALNIDNKLLINHTVNSHPFLIAITNDQTEPLLLSIFWQRLLHTDHMESTSDFASDNIALQWSTLRQAIKNFVKAQFVQARGLERYEICHIQAMILMNRLIQCESVEDYQNLEMTLYGNLICDSSDQDSTVALRTRLLNEEILPTVPIERREFMTEKCISLLDCQTELNHTVWQWLFRATEVVQDVGHRFCPSPAIGEKKTAKTKKQTTTVEDYQTMLSLFNKGYLTFCPTLMLNNVFSTEEVAERNDIMLLRFCDENAGYLSLAYGIEDGKPKIGSISSEQIKDFKQGLPEVLFDESYPCKFHYLVRLKINKDNPNADPNVLFSIKQDIFPNYRTQRKRAESISVNDDVSIRIDALNGGLLERIPTPRLPSSSGLFKRSSNEMERNQIGNNAYHIFASIMQQLQNQDPSPLSVDESRRASSHSPVSSNGQAVNPAGLDLDAMLPIMKQLLPLAGENNQ